METPKHFRRSFNPSPELTQSTPNPNPPMAKEQAEDSSNPHSAVHTGDWSSLTGCIVLKIVSFLVSMEDFFSFRAVCGSWRSIATFTSAFLSSQPPLLLLTHIPTVKQSFYDISNNRLYKTWLPWRIDSRFTLSYSNGFLITMNRRHHVKILLHSIFNGDQIRLPKIPRCNPSWFKRAVLSSSPCDHCLIVLFSPSSVNMAFCKLSDPQWNLHSWDDDNDDDDRVDHDGDGDDDNDDENQDLLKDLIFFKGRLYGLTGENRLLVVSLFPKPVLNLVGCDHAMDEQWEKMEQRGMCEWMLARTSEDLLLVCFCHSIELNVYRWDFDGCRWLEISSLGGNALFVGSNGFGACVEPTGLGIGGDCVYYVDCHTHMWYEFRLVDRSVKVGGYDSEELIVGNESFTPPVWVLPSVC